VFALMNPLAQLKLVVTALIALSLVAGTAWVTHRFDNARYLSLELSLTAAKAKAEEAAREDQARLDAISYDSDMRQLAAEAALRREAERELAQVRHRVVVGGCVPVGVVRLLRDAALGGAAQGEDFAAGKPDAACSGVGWRDFTQALLRDYTAARQSGERLTALQDWVRKVTR
jgi:hypothetical protein